MIKASFILPPYTSREALAPCIDSLKNQDLGDIEILLPEAEAGSNLPGALNRAMDAAGGEVLFFVAEIVSFAPEFTRTWLGHLGETENAALAYGRFHEAIAGQADRERDVRTDEFDLAEGSLIGPVRAVRKSCIEAVGRYDEALPHAFEYDLRLRLLEQFEAVRIEQPLYRVRAENRDAPTRRDVSHYRCYAPISGREQPRSYLDYAADEERDFQAACRRSLARRGALLETPIEPLACPHGYSGGQPVTVIIPLWNREEYIGATLESVLQTRDCAFEVVVVDNGSSDRGPEIVRAYSERAPVRLIRNPENNIAGALNAGLRASSGKYVCQLDSDDLVTPRTLATLVRHMENHPDAALGVSFYDFIGPNGEALAERGVVRHLEYDRNNLLRTDGVGHARIWHRCALEALGGFDEEHLGNYAEDYDLQLKLSERFEVLRIPEVLYHYRINHKKPGEKMTYAERHQKKTFARRAAIERRIAMNPNKPDVY